MQRENPYLHWNLGNFKVEKRQFKGLPAVSTAEKPVFRGGTHQSAAKYNRLWFGVDRPYRERYFCICGCKQIVNMSPVARPQKTEKPAVQKKPPFFRPLHDLPPNLAAISPRDKYFKKSPMERNR